ALAGVCAIHAWLLTIRGRETRQVVGRPGRQFPTTPAPPTGTLRTCRLCQCAVRASHGFWGWGGCSWGAATRVLQALAEAQARATGAAPMAGAPMVALGTAARTAARGIAARTAALETADQPGQLLRAT